MEFKAYKYLRNKMDEMPSDFSLAYYDPNTTTFVFYACSLITEGNNYKLIGPDEELKKWIDESLKKRHNRLDFDYSKKVGNKIYRMCELVDFSDPRFQRAFEENVSVFSFGNEYFYTADKDFQKINSTADVRRLNREAEKIEAKEIAEWRSKEAGKKTENEARDRNFTQAVIDAFKDVSQD